jgi:hypothetical protein
MSGIQSVSDMVKFEPTRQNPDYMLLKESTYNTIKWNNKIEKQTHKGSIFINEGKSVSVCRFKDSTDCILVF